LRQQFGAISVETQVIRGSWEYQGRLYQDELSRVFVDAEGNAQTREFFRGWKERMKTRFRQVEIYITVHPVEQL
jgi:hypothetical protein